MYFNNVHILNYLAIAMVGLLVGKFTAWCNIRLPENKKIFSKEFIAENEAGLKNNYIFMILTSFLYICLLYKFGLDKTNFFKNLELFYVLNL